MSNKYFARFHVARLGRRPTWVPGRGNFFSLWVVTSCFFSSCTTCVIGTQPNSSSYSDLSAFRNIISPIFTIFLNQRPKFLD